MAGFTNYRNIPEPGNLFKSNNLNKQQVFTVSFNRMQVVSTFLLTEKWDQKEMGSERKPSEDRKY